MLVWRRIDGDHLIQICYIMMTGTEAGHAKMAASTTANQLKLAEMESACSMMFFVKGFAITLLDRTIKRE